MFDNQRWNGWGYTHLDYPLKEQGLAFLVEKIGIGQPRPDAQLLDTIAHLKPSRLADHPLVETDARDRLVHSTGQSLSDWIVKRSGDYQAVVDGVAYPQTAEDVQNLLKYSQETNTQLIPFGGGTSVVGHLTPCVENGAVLAVDMRRMNDLLDFDTTSQLATFQAGIYGPDLEAKLRAQGYTLGHFPQSFEFSTLGGWIATRSSGQQSRHYGRIEQTFAGGEVETPQGCLKLPPFPASAAGPDLREWVLGSEGRLGIITSAAMRVTPLPETEQFMGIFFPNFAQGVEACRAIMQANIPTSMMRLSNGIETETNLMLAGHWGVDLLERYLAMRGAENDKVLLVFGVTGTKHLAKASQKAVIKIARAHDGVYVGAALGKTWQKNRFKEAYLRNTLWDMGYAVDTVETAVTWQQTRPMMQAIETAIRQAIGQFEERAHVFTHLSHLYPTGSSVYTTYVFRLGETPDDTRERWQAMKHAASQAIGQHGGTISHQHGVGTDHAPYLIAEKGELGVQAISTMLEYFDPQHLLNPGKLVK